MVPHGLGLLETTEARGARPLLPLNPAPLPLGPLAPLLFVPLAIWVPAPSRSECRHFRLVSLRTRCLPGVNRLSNHRGVTGIASGPGGLGSNGGGFPGSNTVGSAVSHRAPGSGVVYRLARNALMNWSMRSSSTLSSLSWCPQDCSEIGWSSVG